MPSPGAAKAAAALARRREAQEPDETAGPSFLSAVPDRDDTSDTAEEAPASSTPSPGAVDGEETVPTPGTEDAEPAEPAAEVLPEDDDEDAEDAEAQDEAEQLPHVDPPVPVLERFLGDPAPIGSAPSAPASAPEQEPPQERERVGPPPSGTPIVEVDVDEVIAGISELGTAVFADVEDDDVRDLFRQAVQGFRKGIAVARAKGVLPARPLSFVCCVDAGLDGRVQVFAGDRTVR